MPGTQEQRVMGGVPFELPPFHGTGWTRERLLDALQNEIALPSGAVAIATVYASEIEQDIVAVFERALTRELDPPAERLLFRGAHILGAARLTAGYRPFVALLRGPPDRVEYLLGDAITETLPRILAGMFDGDAAPLLALVDDDEVYEFVRNAALGAFTFLVFDGRVDRTAAEEFLTRFEQQGTAPSGDMVWHAWMTAVALLGLEHLSVRVRAAFDDERIPAEVASEKDYRGLLTAALARPTDSARFSDDGLGYIKDVVEALEFFPDEDFEEVDDRDLYWAPPWPGMPVRNPWREVGRNDPCPCGSGKKFKKCCLPAQP
jgi:uncharacterized protein DUF1186/SEC-C motif-containing protein